MTSEVSLTLFGSPPWGFRCGGGSEHKQPLVVTRVSPGSLACKSGVSIGDQIKAVNGQFTQGPQTGSGWSQTQLNQAINAASSLHLVIVRQGGATTGEYQRPDIQEQTMKSNFTSAPHTTNPKINASARGFGAPAASFKPMAVGGDSGNIQSVANNVRDKASATGQVKFEGDMANTTFSTNTYNTPMGLYSDNNVVNTLNQQSRMAGFGDVVGTPPTERRTQGFQPAKSSVLAAINKKAQGYQAPQTKSFNNL